jgi:hypothetical protein
MASIVIDRLYTKHQNTVSVGIAYLYCNFRRQHEQKPVDLLTSLLKQLVQAQPSMPENVASLYKRYSKTKARPSFDEIVNVLHSVVNGYSRVFLIIDALDKCQVSGDCRRFLSEIFSLQAKTGASLFATSPFIP